MPRPTVIIPGYFASFKDYQELAQSLEKEGIPTLIVPIKKLDWLPTVGGRSMVPILRKINTTVQQTRLQYNSDQVNLIGHSAGGWIARIYMGEKPYTIHNDVNEDTQGLWNARPYIKSLITLGTPHMSREQWTRKNLDFVKFNYPGAFYEDIRYVCIAGKAIMGGRKRGQILAYNSYKITVGVGNTWGDGITPVEAAHLEGAENITLDNVWHSPSSPGKWYGSIEVIPEWIDKLN